jgi:hypothetical protein
LLPIFAHCWDFSVPFWQRLSSWSDYSFLIHIQIVPLLNNQVTIIIHHFSYFLHIWVSSVCYFLRPVLNHLTHTTTCVHCSFPINYYNILYMLEHRTHFPSVTRNVCCFFVLRICHPCLWQIRHCANKTITAATTKLIPKTVIQNC